MVDMSPHVSAVFKELFEEIKSAKQQQWTITNYGVLILAAIYAVGHQLPAGVTHLHSKLKFLAILAVAIAVVGSYFLLRIQSHMERSRHRSDKLHKTYFTPNELRDIGLTDDEINNLGDENDLQGKRWWRSANWRRGLEFTGPLIFVLWIGAARVCCFVVVSQALMPFLPAGAPRMVVPRSRPRDRGVRGQYSCRRDPCTGRSAWLPLGRAYLSAWIEH
jgi:hypothetical protein